MLQSIRTKGVGRIFPAACLLAALTGHPALSAQTPATAQTAWRVTIVLPPRLIAGRPATLAALGVDGKLAAGVKIDVGGQQVTTDSTGRALFNAPASAGYLLAKASGESSAALVDAATDDPPGTLTVAPVIALRDQFSICGGGLSADADGNLVKINGKLSLVLAASPECIVVLPNPNLAAGDATISVATISTQMTAKTSAVSLAFEAPDPTLLPGRKGDLLVRVEGSDEKLRLVVVNQTPGVLGFLRSDAEQVVTSGGSPNVAAIKVQAVASGAFSFQARLIGSPDVGVARRYLQAAELVAPKDSQRDIQKLIETIDRHPQDSDRLAVALDQIRSDVIPSDLRTLLDAARASL